MEQIEGRNAVTEAIRAERPIEKILFAANSMGTLGKIMAQAKEAGIRTEIVNREKLDTISQTGKHQGIIAMAAVRKYSDFSDMVDAAFAATKDPIILLLDGIEDPRNLGALLRSADGAGVSGVVIPQRRASFVSPTVVRASAGAAEYMPVAQVVNIASCIDILKKRGFWICGADAAGEKDYYAADLKGPLAIVIGGEGKGLGRLIKEKCDFLLKIPMYGKISSLNASVAGALIMFEARKQRNI